MRQLMLILGLAAFTFGLSGCGGADESKKDAEAKAVKAPDVPPSGP